MRIGIVGAPGSGKSEFARSLADSITESLGGSTVEIVDDYVDGIGEDSDLAMGEAATYIGNLYVVLGRLALERKADQQAENVITCGTMVDSAVYATVEAVAGQTQQHWIRVQNLMNLLGSLREDAWVYDHVFVLSLDEPDVEDISGKVDRALFMALSAFQMNFTPLTGTLEEKVEQAVEEIRGTAVEVKSEAPVGQGA